jgi:hypothetical protein
MSAFSASDFQQLYRSSNSVTVRRQNLLDSYQPELRGRFPYQLDETKSRK